MSELPEVRRADCGHGFLPLDVPPAAVIQNGQHQQPVYLCEDCRRRLSTPQVERKDVRPERPAPPKVETRDAAPAPAAVAPTMEDGEAYELGRQAARDQRPEDDCPYADRRTKDAREWLRGHRELADERQRAKATEKRSEAPRKG